MAEQAVPMMARRAGHMRLGLIGYGSAGRGIHARLLREVGLRVSAIVVRNPQRVAQARQDWPEAEIYADVDSMLARAGKLDFVVIASPSGSHEEHILEVVAARTPVVVDKPMTTDSESARRVIDAAQAAGVPLTVFQNRRWDPEQLTLAALLREGTIGDVHRFERRWERWRPEPMSRWKELDPQGGGLLLDLGAHLVDSAADCFGPVESVYAELRALTTPTEDDVFLSLMHRAPDSADGGHQRPQVISHLWAGALSGAPGPRTRVLGSKAAYLVTNFEGEPTPFAGLDEDAPGGSLGWLVRGNERVAVRQAPGGHVDFYRQVIAWLTVGGPVPVDPRDALRNAVILDSARLSARTGQRVPIPAVDNIRD